MRLITEQLFETYRQFVICAAVALGALLLTSWPAFADRSCPRPAEYGAGPPGETCVCRDNGSLLYCNAPNYSPPDEPVAEPSDNGYRGQEYTPTYEPSGKDCDETKAPGLRDC